MNSSVWTQYTGPEQTRHGAKRTGPSLDGLGRRSLCLAVLSSTSLLGCSSRPIGEALLPQEGQIRQVDRFAAAQAAAGAREDAMLHPRDFDGPELNSLGQSQLHLMLINRPQHEPLVVYLDLPAQAPLADERRAAVRDFLEQTGLPADAFEVRTGPNPQAQNPAAPGLQHLSKINGNGTATPAATAAGVQMGAGN